MNKTIQVPRVTDMTKNQSRSDLAAKREADELRKQRQENPVPYGSSEWKRRFRSQRSF